MSDQQIETTQQSVSPEIGVLSLPLSVKAILEYLTRQGFEAQYSGQPNVSISGFSDPSRYEPGTAIWLGDIKYLHMAAAESYDKVTLLFARSDLTGLGAFPSVITCADPRNAFMAVVEACAANSRRSGIHPTAIIGSGAIIDTTAAIGPHVVVEDGAVIGADTVVEAGCVITGNVTIGKRCHLFANVCIGADGFGFRKLDNGEMRRLPHMGRVLIGDDVEIGACSVIDRGTFCDTIIGSGTKIDSLTNVGHNARIGETCLIIGGAIGGNSTIGDQAEIIHASLKNRINIGAGAKIGISSVVLRDVDAGAACFGNPARKIRDSDGSK